MLEGRTDIIDYLEKSADSEALSAKMVEKDIEVEMNVLEMCNCEREGNWI